MSDEKKLVCVCCGKPVTEAEALVPTRKVVTSKLKRRPLPEDLAGFVSCAYCGHMARRKGFETCLFTDAMKSARFDEERVARIADVFGVSVQETDEATILTITPKAAVPVVEKKGKPASKVKAAS